MALFAQYAAVGGGLMLLCQFIVAVPCVLLAVLFLATSPARRRNPKYWWVLACFAQPIPVAFLLSRRSQFSDSFGEIWVVSMGLILVGFILIAIWPERGSPA